jgi:hypothetical protein
MRRAYADRQASCSVTASRSTRKELRDALADTSEQAVLGLV